MSKIKKGDTVIVVTGKDKGKTGKVIQVNPEASSVLVEKINMVKKCMRANPQKGFNGGIFSKEMPLSISNVALIDKTTQKPTKVGFKFLEDGKKVRFCKKSGEVIHG